MSTAGNLLIAVVLGLVAACLAYGLVYAVGFVFGLGFWDAKSVEEKRAHRSVDGEINS